MKGETKSHENKLETIDNNSIVSVVVEAMCEKKALNVIDLNLSSLEKSIAEHFIISSAVSTTQVVAIADNVEDKLIEHLGLKVIRREGHQNGLWVILDYGNIMVHIFETESRKFYRLEDLWADAQITTYQD